MTAQINASLQSLQKRRDPFVDILKGIGIVSIVVGHASPSVLPFFNLNIVNFVYGYHIMIFMFILGFLFKRPEDAYPFGYIGKTVLSLGKLYFIYSIVFVALHNVFLALNFISSIPLSFDNICVSMLSSLPFSSGEVLLGAMWFIPMYLVAAILFSTMVCFAERSRCPIALHIIFILVTMTLGIMMHNNPPYYLYHIQTSVLAIPVCYLGYFVKKHLAVLNRFITWYGGIICAISLYLLVTSPLGRIELAANQIIKPYLFYPATLLGIYYCLALAKVLAAFKYTSNLFSYIGKNSFHIMALHFAAFKLVDVVWGAITNAAPEVISVFPVAFNLWYVYYPVGILLPLGIIELVKLTKKYIFKGVATINGKLESRLQ